MLFKLLNFLDKHRNSARAIAILSIIFIVIASPFLLMVAHGSTLRMVMLIFVASYFIISIVFVFSKKLLYLWYINLFILVIFNITDSFMVSRSHTEFCEKLKRECTQINNEFNCIRDDGSEYGIIISCN